MCVICVEWKRKKTNSCFWVVKRSYTQIAYRFVGSKATGSVITPKLMGTSFFQANVSIIICKMGILYARTHFTRVCNNIFRFLAPLNCRSFTFDFRNAIWISAVHQTTCNVKSKYGMCKCIYTRMENVQSGVIIVKCVGGKSRRRTQFRWCIFRMMRDLWEKLIPVKVYINVIGRSSVQNEHIHWNRIVRHQNRDNADKRKQNEMCSFFFIRYFFNFLPMVCKWFCMAIHMTSTDTYTWYDSKNRMTMMRKRRKKMRSREREKKKKNDMKQTQK